jgi:hypothetical protein
MTNNKLWFRAKRYGWGWYPASWEGYTVFVVLIGLMVLNFLRLNMGAPDVSNSTILTFVAEAIGLLIILYAVCYAKGEKPRWRWGTKNNAEKTL